MLPRTYATPARLLTARRSNGLCEGASGVFFTATAMALPRFQVSDFRLAIAAPIRGLLDCQSQVFDRKSQQGRSDSNAQPAVLETAALPIELHPFGELLVASC